MIHVYKSGEDSRSVRIEVNGMKELLAEVHTLGVAINTQFEGNKKVLAIIGSAFIDGLVDGEESEQIKGKDEITDGNIARFTS